MQLPPDSTRARFFWSVPAFLIIVLWAIGVFGAAVTGFTVKYTFLDVLCEIARCELRMIWPGEYGNSSRWWGRAIQFSYLLPVVTWPLCLIGWQARWQRLLSTSITFLVPSLIFLVVHPLLVLIGPFLLATLILTTKTGEEWQDGWMLGGAASLWLWFLVLLNILTWRHVRIAGHADRCPSCGYSTTGLTHRVCPECGHANG